MATKITRATFKSFIRKAGANLYVKVTSDFDGMVDCVMECDDARFAKAKPTECQTNYTLGISGLWLSRDSYFGAYEDSQFTGIQYHNCCGSGVIAIRK